MAHKYSLETLRHSAAHLLAHAIFELYPETLFTIGPATADGFFYDVLPKRNFTNEDLPKIQARMVEISQRNLPIEHKEVLKDEARKLFANNPFKLELIDGIPGDTAGIATQGNFIDLCRGGHVASTGDIKHFKLTAISGSYWRADKSNQALQRISGTAFFSQEDMDEYERLKEEAKQFDHRRLGKQLDLFSFHEEGVGFPFFHPKGKTIINLLIEYMRKEQRAHGYQEISTPIMLSESLWHRSGHYEFYKDNMYFTKVDEHTYAIRPMNCPGAYLVYGERPHSFRELPLRLAEFGLVHRHELSGVLHGLMRVRAFTQDDSHTFCAPEQLEQEITTKIKLIVKVMNKFEFANIAIALSTKPERAMGSDALWSTGTTALKNALDAAGVDYSIQEGEGAFYGPKIEFLITDSMKRSWQCGTIQVDFCAPENFDLNYVASGGNKQRPVVVHQAIYGSLERFFAIVLEHYKGNLPFWLAPIQMKVLTITDDQQEYAQQITAQLAATGYRVELDTTSDQISAKIKSAQLAKVPWMLVIGKKEVANQTVTLRYLDGTQEFGISLDTLIDKAKNASS